MIITVLRTFLTENLEIGGPPMFDKTKTYPDALRKYQFIKAWKKLNQSNEKINEFYDLLRKYQKNPTHKAVTQSETLNPIHQRIGGRKTKRRRARRSEKKL